jgi:hypothetical protein
MYRAWELRGRNHAERDEEPLPAPPEAGRRRRPHAVELHYGGTFGGIELRPEREPLLLLVPRKVAAGCIVGGLQLGDGSQGLRLLRQLSERVGDRLWVQFARHRHGFA